MTEKNIKYLNRKNELQKEISVYLDTYGVENTTIRDLCKHLNISIGNFYYYFPKRNDIASILFSIVDEYIEKELLNVKLNDELSTIKYICYLYAKKNVESGPEIVKFITNAIFKDSSSNYFDEDRKIVTLLKNLVATAMQKEIMNDKIVEANQLVFIFLTTIRGIAIEWAKRNGDFDLIEKTNKTIELLLLGLIVEKDSLNNFV